MSEQRAEVRSSVRQYANEVARRLRDLPAEQRAEIQSDLVDRLAELGVTHYDVAVRELGTPAAYAAEFRQAMELPPYRRVRDRRLLWVGAAVGVLAVVGAGLYVWLHDPVPTDYPVAVQVDDVDPPGELVGSVIVTPAAFGERIAFTFILSNYGNRTVRVLQIAEELGNRPGDSFEPPFTPEITVSPPTKNLLTYIDRDAVPVAPFGAFTLAPHEAVLVNVTGTFAACVNDSEASATDHFLIDLAIDGEARTIRAPEIVYRFGNCA